MNIFRSSRRKKTLPPLSPTSTPQTAAANVESGEQQQQQKRSPRLDRTNAVRYVTYDAEFCTYDGESSGKGSLKSRSFDLCVDNACLRINGEDNGQLELFYSSLDLSGPEDFGIPMDAWKARKTRSASDAVRSSIFDGSFLDCSSPSSSPKRPNTAKEPKTGDDEVGEVDEMNSIPQIFSASCSVRDDEMDMKFPRTPNFSMDDSNQLGGGLGIRGVRPPTLSTGPYLPPPPGMSASLVEEEIKAWDSVNSFAPQDESSDRVTEKLETRSSVLHYDNQIQDDDGGVQEMVDEFKELRFIVPVAGEFTGSCSFTTTSNDDDCSSTTTEGIYVISPNCRWRPHVGHWSKGRELGRGSYGVVYEAFSEVGDFFAVKEVSLHNEKYDAIEQLEREILFLSNFEHENIVRYLGTDKGDRKLYIFLELVTQGSLSSLYKNYVLRDSQVSSYTRQILNGLKYLHTKNVVHRDIKCANILVAANGSVKLADFGLAKQTTQFGLLNSCKGSVYWMAPEVINPKKGGGYGIAADIWSLGCTVLEMFTRQPPFPNLEWAQAFYRIANGLTPDIPDSLSRDAADFIGQCIQVNPDDRPTAQKLLEHPFFRKQLPASVGHGLDSSGRGRQTWAGS